MAARSHHMTAEEEQRVATQIEAARRQGVEEGRKQKDREWSRWELVRIILGLLIPVVPGCISLGVTGSFWFGFIIGLILECIPWWIFLFF